MTVTLQDVRSFLRDTPKPVPPRTSPPEVLGIGDGITTTFFLGSPTALAPPAPTIITFGTIIDKTMRHVQQLTGWQFVPNSYDSPGIVFTTPPPIDTVVGARYFRAMFTDAELNRFMALAETRGSDRLTLKGIVCDIIPVILLDDDKMRVYTLGDTKSDPSQIRTALTDMLAKLTAEIQTPNTYDDADIAIGVGEFSPFI